MEISEAEFAKANARMRELRAKVPHAVAVEYDSCRERIVVALSTGFDVAFPPRALQGLEHATPEELAVIEIDPSGFGLRWPLLDADHYLPGLLEGVFGSRAWMAAKLGAEGGKAANAKKAAAARKNGKLGGRPKKFPAECV